MDLECQKKMICEIYQDQAALGELSTRGRHSLDYMDTVEYFSLPEVIANTIDEFQVRMKTAGTFIIAAEGIKKNKIH